MIFSISLNNDLMIWIQVRNHGFRTPVAYMYIEHLNRNKSTLRIFLTQLVHLVVGEGEGVDAPGQILAAPAKKQQQ